LYSLDRSVEIDIESIEKLKKFILITTVRRKSCSFGQTMSPKDKADCKERSALWLSFIRALWTNSGLFSLKSPVGILLTELQYDTLVAKFTKVVFEKIFFSVSRMLINGSDLQVITSESKYYLKFIYYIKKNNLSYYLFSYI